MAKLPATDISTTMVGNAIGSSSRSVGTLFLHPNCNRYGWGAESGGDRVRNWGKYSPESLLHNTDPLKMRTTPYNLGAFRGYDHTWAFFFWKRLFLNGLSLSYRSGIVNSEQTFIMFDIPVGETITINYTVTQRWLSYETGNWRDYSADSTLTVDITTVNQSINLISPNSSIIAESDIYVKINSVTDTKGGWRFWDSWPAPSHPYPNLSEPFKSIEKNSDGFVKIDDRPDYYLHSKVNTQHIGSGYASPVNLQYYNTPANSDNLAEMEVWFINYSNLAPQGDVVIEVRSIYGDDKSWVNISSYHGAQNHITVMPCEFSDQLTNGVYSKLRVEVSLSLGDSVLNVGDDYEMRVTIIPDDTNQWDVLSVNAGYKNDPLPDGSSIQRPARGLWRQF